MPSGWLVTRWSRSLFQQTLVEFVQHDLLAYPDDPNHHSGNVDPTIERGVIFLPFCAHVMKELVAGMPILKEFFEISFVHNTNLDVHALWKGTMTIDGKVMQGTFGKRVDQENIYCTFNKYDVLDMMADDSVSLQEVVNILEQVPDYDNVRFVRLRPLSQHNKNRQGDAPPEVGGFKRGGSDGLDHKLLLTPSQRKFQKERHDKFISALEEHYGLDDLVALFEKRGIEMSSRGENPTTEKEKKEEQRQMIAEMTTYLASKIDSMSEADYNSIVTMDGKYPQDTQKAETTTPPRKSPTKKPKKTKAIAKRTSSKKKVSPKSGSASIKKRKRVNKKSILSKLSAGEDPFILLETDQSLRECVIVNMANGMKTQTHVATAKDISKKIAVNFRWRDYPALEKCLSDEKENYYHLISTEQPPNVRGEFFKSLAKKLRQAASDIGLAFDISSKDDHYLRDRIRNFYKDFRKHVQEAETMMSVMTRHKKSGREAITRTIWDAMQPASMKRKQDTMKSSRAQESTVGTSPKKKTKTSTQTEAEDEMEKVEFARCDACNKWDVLPSHITAKSLEKKNYYCVGCIHLYIKINSDNRRSADRRRRPPPIRQGRRPRRQCTST